ncbi:hypothetical protein BDA99DRAFT_563791 [Phascolomyces articulosus]|uniref:RRM domain-containing protein n=1 Tax=Phascolomyces articulosus TaxID=60185 RepID=A0AAD5JRY7_9FUNG|nr:hypothetical protein BDA99DRAFT_563791 [Phascolomyces articulosus]
MSKRKALEVVDNIHIANCNIKKIHRLCDVCFIKCPKRGSQAALFVEHKALCLPRMKLCVNFRVTLYQEFPEPMNPVFQNLIVTKTRAQELFKLGDWINDIVPGSRQNNSIITSDQLQKVFMEFGVITQSRIIYNRDTTTSSKGYGFIEFSNCDDALVAIAQTDDTATTVRPRFLQG